MAHEPGEVRIGDRLHDEPVVQLLRLVDVVTAWIATRVEMPDPLNVVADGANDVAVHDLRVVDVVENLDPRRLPENVMMFGTLARADSSMAARSDCSIRAWFSLRFKASAIVPPGPSGY